MADEVHIHVETYEGTLLFSDKEVQGVKAVSVLNLTMLQDTPAGPLVVRTNAIGPTGMVAHSLTDYFLQNPGLLEAVTGLHHLAMYQLQQRKEKGS